MVGVFLGGVCGTILSPLLHGGGGGGGGKGGGQWLTYKESLCKVNIYPIPNKPHGFCGHYAACLLTLL